MFMAVFDSVYVCAPHVSGGYLQRQKRALDLLGLESQRVVSPHVSSEARTSVL